MFRCAKDHMKLEPNRGTVMSFFKAVDHVVEMYFTDDVDAETERPVRHASFNHRISRLSNTPKICRTAQFKAPRQMTIVYSKEYLLKPYQYPSAMVRYHISIRRGMLVIELGAQRDFANKIMTWFAQHRCILSPQEYGRPLRKFWMQGQ